MSVTSVDKDLDNLTLTLIADLDAPVERVWELWADPRQLEKWWGPPTHPATVEDHDLSPGGRVSYFMTAPDGERYHGWWRITAATPPTSLEFVDGFADEHGNPVGDLPESTAHVLLSEHHGGTRMELRSTFATREQMQSVLDMGVVEGLSSAVGQMDALLAG
ncbi:MAG: SRPBCC domain-containing protein [Nitriliruptoraceae bacterium]